MKKLIGICTFEVANAFSMVLQIAHQGWWLLNVSIQKCLVHSLLTTREYSDLMHTPGACWFCSMICPRGFCISQRLCSLFMNNERSSFFGRNFNMPLAVAMMGFVSPSVWSGCVQVLLFEKCTALLFTWAFYAGAFKCLASGIRINWTIFFPWDHGKHVVLLVCNYCSITMEK